MEVGNLRPGDIFLYAGWPAIYLGRSEDEGYVDSTGGWFIEPDDFAFIYRDSSGTWRSDAFNDPEQAVKEWISPPLA